MCYNWASCTIISWILHLLVYAAACLKTVQPQKQMIIDLIFTFLEWKIPGLKRLCMSKTIEIVW